MEKVTVILDNGHGQETPGKCSPDSMHREWAWTRGFVRELSAALQAKGVATHILVPEDSDVPLRERCRRANAVAGRTILVSVHNNAAGSGKAWSGASGFSAFVAPNASEASRRLAKLFTYYARGDGLTGNRSTPPCGYWQANLAICRDTVCPAVLTENMFQDNRDDVAFLASADGRARLLKVHIEAILKFINSL